MADPNPEPCHPMCEFPKILDGDLVRLRPMQQEDLPAVIEQLGDPDIAQWLAAVAHPFGPPEARELLEFSRDPRHCVRIVLHRGDVAGCFALAPGLWFWLAPEHHGQGVMTRSLRAAIAAYFRRPAAPLIATSRADNTASLALLTRLGFSRCPATRRMFFQATGTSHACADYAMTMEQWHFLYPPQIAFDALTVRPAVQKDAAALARILPRAGGAGAEIWPDPQDIGDFIEAHRCRAWGTGLFVIEDSVRTTCGMVLLKDGKATPARCFTSVEYEKLFHQAAPTIGSSGTPVT